MTWRRSRRSRPTSTRPRGPSSTAAPAWSSCSSSRSTTPFPVEEQVVSIWAGTTGQLDDVPVEDIRRFETEFLDYLHRNNEGLLTSIRETKDLTDDSITTLKDAMDRFRRTFEVTGGKLLVSDDDSRSRRSRASEVDQETVAKYSADAGPASTDGE